MDPYNVTPSPFKAGAAALTFTGQKSLLPGALTYMMSQGKDK